MNSVCVPSGGFASGSSTVVQFCQPPVGAMFAVSPTSWPSGASRRSWIVPARAGGGDAEAQSAQLLEVDALEGDVVTVLDEADVLAAARVAGRLLLHAGGAGRGSAGRATRRVIELRALAARVQDRLVLAVSEPAGPVPVSV
jgi:hypothetical protein